MLRVLVWHTHPDERLKDELTNAPRQVRLHGIVLDEPVELFEPNELGLQTCAMHLRHVEVGGRWRPITGRVRATFQEPKTPVAYGDEVVVEGQWSRVP